MRGWKHWNGKRDQHSISIHRASERHFSLKPGCSGAPRSSYRSQAGHTDCGYESCGLPRFHRGNFCWRHESLRLAAPEGSERKWMHRTPAMAAGLTDHHLSMLELLSYQVPLPAWVAPKQRGRPPKEAKQMVMAGVA